MKHETSKALYEYWLSCYRGVGVRATGISPAELAAILPSVFLIDLDASEGTGFRFRFCGAALATRYGRDLTDESFLALWGPTDAGALKRDLGAAGFRSTGMVAGVMAETVSGGYTSHEMLLLPLASETGTAGAIGSMVRVAGHDETNRIRARVVSQSLRSIRFLPDARQNPERAARVAGPAFSPAPVKMRRRYGHLTVVTGGR